MKDSTDPDIKIGSIWQDINHKLYREKNLDFYCLVLSADYDSKNNLYLYKLACFMKIGEKDLHGAWIRELTANEVKEMKNIDDIKNILFKK